MRCCFPMSSSSIRSIPALNTRLYVRESELDEERVLPTISAASTLGLECHQHLRRWACLGTAWRTLQKARPRITHLQLIPARRVLATISRSLKLLMRVHLCGHQPKL